MIEPKMIEAKRQDTRTVCRICARNVPLQKFALCHLDNAAWLRYLLSNRLTSRGL